MDTEEDRRQAAIKRIQARRGFNVHLAVYLVVSALLILIWLTTGGGYFWPAWSLVGWGIGIAAHRWAIYVQKPISEEDIRREMERNGSM